MTVDALRRGDPGALADLLERFGGEIHGVAYLILRDHAGAEDVLTETLLSALERASSLRDPAALRPWLLRIATNHALARRRRGARITLLAVMPEVPTVDPDMADHVALLAGLAALPVRARAAVVLHYYADLSVADVALAMGTSPNTVKTQLRQALDRLRISMADPPPTIGNPEVARG